MTKKSKAIAAIISLVCVCIACIWLSPYISYALLVSSINRAARGHMHCWVKVVDQNGNGVQGYNCMVVQGHTSWWPFSKNNDIVRNYTSGSDGLFEYKSKGTTGRVFFGNGWGSQWKSNPRHLLQRNDFNIYTYKLNRAKESNPTNYMGSKKNPFILHVFSLGQPQELLFWDKKVQLKEKHDWLCVNILAGKVWESTSPEGDIAIRDNGFTHENAKRYCWQSFIAGPECEVFPAVDDWGLEPPKDGYKKELCMAKDWLAVRKTSLIRKAVYFRMSPDKDGKYVYGKLVLGGSGRAADSKLQCFANLHGKRNLYFSGYEQSVMRSSYWQINNYISPPVDPADLSSGVQRERKIIE